MPLIKRPAGITLLLSIHFLGAALLAFIAVVMFALMGEATSGTTFNTDIAEGLKPFIAGAGLILGILMLFCAAILVLLGVFLWRLKNWARILTMILALINLTFCVTGSVLALTSGAGVLLLILLTGSAVNFWIMWYLLRPHVKAAYGAKGFYL